MKQIQLSSLVGALSRLRPRFRGISPRLGHGARCLDRRLLAAVQPWSDSCRISFPGAPVSAPGLGGAGRHVLGVRLYRGIWRFASIPDMARILKSALAGLAIITVISFFLTRLENVPRSVFVLDGILLILLLGGPRILYRWIKDRHLYLGSGKRTLIVGAGSAGELLARDLMRASSSSCRPVAFVDDDPDKAGKEIHGYPVAGNCSRYRVLPTNLR